MTPSALFGFLALLGTLGVFVRYALRPLNELGPWPWGTFLANLLGCFLILFVANLDEAKIPPRWALLISVGLLGGMTTFSSYLLELHGMANRSQWGLFGGYLVGTHLAAFGAAALGVVAARVFG